MIQLLVQRECRPRLLTQEIFREIATWVCTWWFIPLSKWVITPIRSGLTLLIPFITGVISHLLTGMSHQVGIVTTIHWPSTMKPQPVPGCPSSPRLASPKGYLFPARRIPVLGFAAVTVTTAGATHGAAFTGSGKSSINLGSTENASYLIQGTILSSRSSRQIVTCKQHVPLTTIFLFEGML